MQRKSYVVVVEFSTVLVNASRSVTTPKGEGRGNGRSDLHGCRVPLRFQCQSTCAEARQSGSVQLRALRPRSNLEGSQAVESVCTFLPSGHFEDSRIKLRRMEAVPLSVNEKMPAGVHVPAGPLCPQAFLPAGFHFARRLFSPEGSFCPFGTSFARRPFSPEGWHSGPVALRPSGTQAQIAHCWDFLCPQAVVPAGRSISPSAPALPRRSCPKAPRRRDFCARCCLRGQPAPRRAFQRPGDSGPAAGPAAGARLGKREGNLG